MVTKKFSKKSKTEHYALRRKFQNFCQSFSGKSQNGQIFLSKMKIFTFNYKNMKIHMRLT